MHLCFLYPYYPPEKESFGIGTFIWEMTHALVKIPGVRVTVVTRSHSQTDILENCDGIYVHRVSEQGMGLERVVNSLSRHVLSMYFFSQRVRKIISDIHKENRIDLLETCDFGGDSISFPDKAWLFPVVVRCHTPGFLLDYYNQCESKSVSLFTSLFEKKILQRAANLIFSSEGLYREVIKHVSISGNVSLQPYLIDLNQVAKKMWKDVGPQLKFVAVGRVEKRKGADQLCRSFSQLIEEGCRADLYFVGRDSYLLPGGSYISYLKKEVITRKGAPYIHFLPEIDRQQLLQVICNYDVLVLPSRFEGVGYVAIEAMAACLPVIGSIHGGTSELVVNGVTGFAVDPGNVDDLTCAMRRLICDRNLTQLLGKNGRKRVKKRYMASIVSREAVEYYRKIIAEKRVYSTHKDPTTFFGGPNSFTA